MSKAASKELHAEIAAAKTALAIHIPIATYLGEATELAKFVTEYWEPQHAGAESVARPGLSSVAKKKTAGYALSAHTGDEILALVEAAKDAQTAFQLAERPHVDTADVARAHAVLSNLEAALDFLFDDGKDDANDDALAHLHAAHAHDHSIDELASALDDYGALASAHEKQLHGLGDFDVKEIAEAGALATALRGRDAATTSPASIAAKEARDRTLNVLAVRVEAVRAATRFVFRAFPDVLRKAASAYERKKRAASRRAAAKGGAGASNAPAAPAAPAT